VPDAMGKRLLREWLCRPSASMDVIRARQRCVGALKEDRRMASELFDALEGVQDVPRIAARIALGRATPRDLVALGAIRSASGSIASRTASNCLRWAANAPTFTMAASSAETARATAPAPPGPAAWPAPARSVPRSAAHPARPPMRRKVRSPSGGLP